MPSGDAAPSRRDPPVLDGSALVSYALAGFAAGYAGRKLTRAALVVGGSIVISLLVARALRGPPRDDDDAGRDALIPPATIPPHVRLLGLSLFATVADRLDADRDGIVSASDLAASGAVALESLNSVPRLAFVAAAVVGFRAS